MTRDIYWYDKRACAWKPNFRYTHAMRVSHSTDSPRYRNKEGKLVFVKRENPLTFQRAHYISIRSSNPWDMGPADVQSGGFYPPGFSYNKSESEAYSRLVGKLRKGSASWGVTLSQWRETRDMMEGRLRSFAKRLDTVERRIRKTPWRKRPMLESPADMFLEHTFGWQPLIEDIFNGFIVLTEEILGEQRIAVRVRERGLKYTKAQSNGFVTWEGESLVSASALIQLRNPMFWMANRLGLLNPATVVWDIIPWSFVVNWFVNVNTMLSQFTDFAGVQVSSASTTFSAKFLVEELRIGSGDGYIHSSKLMVSKDRYLRLPDPHFSFRVPELNAGLLAIASSLVVQKFHKINNLLRVI